MALRSITLYDGVLGLRVQGILVSSCSRKKIGADRIQGRKGQRPRLCDCWTRGTRLGVDGVNSQRACIQDIKRPRVRIAEKGSLDGSVKNVRGSCTGSCNSHCSHKPFIYKVGINSLIHTTCNNTHSYRCRYSVQVQVLKKRKPFAIDLTHKASKQASKQASTQTGSTAASGTQCEGATSAFWGRLIRMGQPVLALEKAWARVS
jgi:hypothetical protein